MRDRPFLPPAALAPLPAYVRHKLNGDRKSVQVETYPYPHLIGVAVAQGQGALGIPFGGEVTDGVERLWHTIEEHRALIEASGELDRRRREQSREWMWKLVEEGVTRAFREQPGMAEAIAREEESVEALKTTPAAAARTLLDGFLSARSIGRKGRL